MRSSVIWMTILVLGCTQGAAGAEVVSGKIAKKALYSGANIAVQVLNQPFLTVDQEKILGSVATQQPYYGAVAVSPDEGLMSEATVAAADYHTIEAASVAALAGCDAARKGASPCVIVALVRPKGWEARPVQLSSTATSAFRKDYRGKVAALAVSAETGAWAMAKGPDAGKAAVAACAAKLSGPNDCSVIIAD